MEQELGVAAVARELGSSRSAVRKAIVRGKLRATLVAVPVAPDKVQTEYRVARSEVERYQAEHRTARKS